MRHNDIDPALLDRYGDFIANLHLRHFRPAEFTSYCRRIQAGVQNTHPPIDMWRNIIPTIWIVDLLRTKIDTPITLSSIYRSPAYNEVVGGTSDSLHLRHNAIDFQTSNLTLAHETLKQWRLAGVFSGGLKKYATFIHIDTRGYNANW